MASVVIRTFISRFFVCISAKMIYCFRWEKIDKLTESHNLIGLWSYLLWLKNKVGWYCRSKSLLSSVLVSDGLPRGRNPVIIQTKSRRYAPYVHVYVPQFLNMWSIHLLTFNAKLGSGELHELSWTIFVMEPTAFYFHFTFFPHLNKLKY